jgi:hypothetical protein
VQQARDRNRHVVDRERPAIPPDGLEIVSRHGQSQVDIQFALVGGPDRGAAFDDPLREPPVVRPVERLEAVQQLQPDGLAAFPASQQIVGVERQKEIAVPGREDR